MNSLSLHASTNHLGRFKSIGNVVLASLGAITIVLAMIALLTNMQVSDIFAWITQYFGITFSVLFILLVVCSGVAIKQLSAGKSAVFWQEIGLQSANGISTLALTFTLLGISLGIGALSQQSLTPDNINNVISLLTTQFSMAFMTTVVGLPAATIVRAWVSIISARNMCK